MKELVPALLWLLAVTDSAFAGFRDAAGRDGRVFKEEYYRRAIRRGLKWGIAATGLAGALVLGVVAAARNPSARLDELETCGLTLLPFLAVYATLVLVALGVWAMAEADARTLASVVILGPFTLVRPYVILTAAAFAAWRAPSAVAAMVTVAACGIQLAVEPWLGRAWRGGRRPLP